MLSMQCNLSHVGMAWYRYPDNRRYQPCTGTPVRLRYPRYRLLKLSGYARYPLVTLSRNTGVRPVPLRELPGYARYPPVPISRNTGVRSVLPGTGFSKYRGTLGTPRYPMKIPVPTICTITIPDTDPFVGHSISVELLYHCYFILLGLLFI